MITLKKWLATAAIVLLPAAHAADFPTRPVQLLVPFGAGGSIDLTARALGKAMEKTLGTPVVVVNKPGAGGTIALAEVARAAPDGYTLGVALAANAAIAPQIQKVPYDSLKDLTPIANYTTSTIYVAVKADSPYQTLEDVLTDIKARPGEVMVGITTLGSTTHLSTARMLKDRGLSTEYVTFGGGAQVITALLGGHIPVATLAGEALPYATSGRVRFLASFSRESVPALANVPSILDMGFSWEADSWVGIAAPAGLDPAIRARLEQSVLEAASDPEFLRVNAEMAMLAQPLDGEALGELMKQSYEGIGVLVKDAGLASP